FELSEAVYKICKLRVKSDRKGKESKFILFGKRIWNFFKHYFSGLALGLPIATQIAFIAFTGYSLWAWVKFSELQATIVAFGTILSFITTGGFTQVMGREVTYYLSLGNKKTARDIAIQIFNYGVIFTVLVALLLLFLNANINSKLCQNFFPCSSSKRFTKFVIR
ncbi:hypothetical protein JGI20_00888, partial [Candidatus Kryptobacter tengchongensis]